MQPKNILNTLVGGLRKIKIQTRLLYTILALSLCPTIIIGLYAFQVYTQSINKKLSDTAVQTVNQLNKTLGTELDKFTIYLNALSVSDIVQDALKSPNPKDEFATYSSMKAIQSLVNDVTVPINYLNNIRVADSDGNTVFDTGYKMISSEQHATILTKLDSSSPKDSLQYIKVFGSADGILLGRSIYDFSTNRHIGYILLYLSETGLRSSVYQDTHFGENSTILLLGEDSQVISSQNTSLLGEVFANGVLMEQIHQAEQNAQSSFTLKQDGVSQLVVFSKNNRYDTYFAAMIPRSYITQETSQINRNLIFVVAALILASFTITFLVYLSIIRPIRKIVDSCNVVADEDVNLLINDQSPDEMGFLARTIDHIILELKSMARAWENNQKRRRELELEMLQYQINPHFLFNTLNTFKWVAVMNEVPVLSDGMTSLAALLQSTLIRTDEFIPVHEEVDNLRHYFALQTIRYANSFTVEYHIDEELQNYLIPRFILQPIAENSIIHGTSESGRCITITVSCTRLPQGGLVLEISDDGSGFDVAKLQSKTEKERFSGIGLSNVDERLKLHFGPEYGLQVHSQPGFGCSIKIHVPQHWLDKEGG